MQYMMMFNESPQDVATGRADGAASEAYWGAWNSFIGAMFASGVAKYGDGLQPPDTATTLRIVDGKRVIHDGPFADTKELLGGYMVIEVPDLDAALEWAAKAPCAQGGSVEIRPVLPPPAQ
jgi:hypothetical protein